MILSSRPPLLFATLLLTLGPGCIVPRAAPRQRAAPPPSSELTLAQFQYQRISSGLIGCAPDEIRITHDVWGHHATWEADCRGHHFFCSHVYEWSSQWMCKESLPPVTPPEPPPVPGAS